MAAQQHQVFLSFHYERDFWRAAQIREYGFSPLTCNDWEPSKMNNVASIARWIDSQMKPASCTVVLIGSETANRDWINYEIEKSWQDGKGLLGIYIHNVPDQHGQQSEPGTNPFEHIIVNGVKLSHFAKVYDPEPANSRQVCRFINDNIAQWVDAAVLARTKLRD